MPWKWRLRHLHIFFSIKCNIVSKFLSFFQCIVHNGDEIWEVQSIKLTDILYIGLRAITKILNSIHFSRMSKVESKILQKNIGRDSRLMGTDWFLFHKNQERWIPLWFNYFRNNTKSDDNYSIFLLKLIKRWQKKGINYSLRIYFLCL